MLDEIKEAVDPDLLLVHLKLAFFERQTKNHAPTIISYLDRCSVFVPLDKNEDKLDIQLAKYAKKVCF
jgi:hypothetical protein